MDLLVSLFISRMASKGRNYRRRNYSDDEEESAEQDTVSVSEKLEEVKEMQKFRVRPKGVTPSGLAFGSQVEEAVEEPSDPFKIKTGGLLDLNTVKDRDRDRSGEAADKDVTSLGSNFSQETNRRDEDLEMLKFIEDELAKRKGIDRDKKTKTEKPKTAEDLLYEVPEHINVKSKVMKSEEMLSNQMLSGIPEVDLGIHAKIKNIEATEEAKGKILNEMKNKRKAASDFVPTNLASNFLLHDRFFNEHKVLESEKRKEKARKEEERLGSEKNKGPVVVEDTDTTDQSSSHALSSKGQGKRKTKDEASDDYLYEKFKKKARDSWRYQ